MGNQVEKARSTSATATALTSQVTLAVLTSVFACRPDLDDTPSLVARPRVVAIVAEPPEAAPGDAVVYKVYAADPSGPAAPEAVSWAYCASPKPLTENNAVAAACLGNSSVVPIAGDSPEVSSRVPADACKLFGPDAPPGGFRPRDPDETGGYYQPVRARFSFEDGIHLQRVRCNLANAPADVVLAFNSTYQRNVNPVLVSVVASLDGNLIGIDRIPQSARVVFRARWREIDAETFVVYDAQSRALVRRREALRVSWISTGGQFATAITGRADSDDATDVDNEWRAPGDLGNVTLWVVLRDSRGGSAVSVQTVTVVERSNLRFSAPFASVAGATKEDRWASSPPCR